MDLGGRPSPPMASASSRQATTKRRVWSSADGNLLATLQGHSGPLLHATFSPDGQRVFTASEDQTARIWQVLTLDDIERILAK